jgi:SMI1 / KNR4 family (SUKH-1)
MKYNDFIKELLNFNWQFESADKDISVDIDNAIDGKFAKTNNDLIPFIKSFNTLANEEDNTWYIPLEDYLKEDETEGFAWNEFEVESLEYAEDESQITAIKNFWNNHLPFMMNVKNGYAYLAIVLNGEDKGKIVSGNEPEYEETVTIASSLDEFFDKYILVLKDELDFPTLKMLS